MKGKAIHQITSGFLVGDAISDEALNIQKVLRQQGSVSEIFSDRDHIAETSRQLCGPMESFSPTETDLLIYHYSIGSTTLPDALAFPGKKLMIYHNISPPEYFEEYNPEIADRLRSGRQGLGEVSREFDIALADSDFNRRELDKLGFQDTGVLPILFDRSKLLSPSNLRRPFFLRKPRTTVLFVGRLVPNKKAEDLLGIFNLYQKYYNPASRLVWVGSWGGMELYHRELKMMIDDLGLEDVYLTGHIPREVLAACFVGADVFVSVSEHEGFCVPVLESFHYGLPIIAYAAAAVPETVGDAGILLAEKDSLTFAEAIDVVCRDKNLKRALAQRGLQRLSDQFSFDRTAELLVHNISRLLGPAA